MSGLNGRQLGGAFAVPGEPFEVDVGEVRFVCKPLNAPARAKVMIAGGVQHVPEGGEVAITPDVLSLAVALGVKGWRWIEPRTEDVPEGSEPDPAFDPLTHGLPPFPAANPEAMLDFLDNAAFLQLGQAIVEAAFVTEGQAGN